MEALPMQRDIVYTASSDAPRLMDVYYPSEAKSGGGWPAVILVAGYPGGIDRRPTPPAYKEFGWTISMAQLIARSGMAAIAYTNREPVADLERLVEYVHHHARSLEIDASRIGILAASGNAPAALSRVLGEAPRPPQCAVFEYGCLLDLDGACDVADASRQFGFVNPCAGRNVSDLRRDVPLFIARAGRDQFPAMNASIDRFVSHALAQNLPVSVVNHPDGPHAFDLFDDSRTSRGIVRQALQFLTQHLTT